MYSIQQFINENQGTLIASRGGITGQCVSLVQKWGEVNGVSGSPVFPVANAKDMNGSTRQDAYTWIPNKVGDPTSKPQPGDTVVFSWNHTGLCVTSDGYTIQMFQQNDPTGSTAHMKSYNFNGCTGWLRLKNTNQGVPAMASTRQDTEAAFRGFLGRGGGNEWDGQPFDVMINGIRNSPEGQAYATRILSVPAPDVLAAQVADLQKQLAQVTKQYQDLLAKPPVSGGIDQATKDQIADTNTKVTWIQSLLTKIFK